MPKTVYGMFADAQLSRLIRQVDELQRRIGELESEIAYLKEVRDEINLSQYQSTELETGV